MELPVRIRSELQRVVRSTHVRTRIGAVLAVLLGAGVLCTWVVRSSTRNLVPLGATGELSQSDLAGVGAAIRAAGLPEPLLRDGQLLVPESELERYRGVIGERVDEPQSWAETWEQANATLSRFSLSAERDDVREISRAKLTSRLLNELPGVEHADLVWDEESQPGWNRPPLVRATVYLKPMPEHRITLQTVHAVRLAVAGSKAYLDPEDVVVVDLNRMVAFDQAALGADFSTRYGEIARLTADYRQRAEDAVAHISGATVSVAVEPIRDVENPAPPQSEPALTGNILPAVTGFRQERPNTGLEIPTGPWLDPRHAVAESPAVEDPDDTAVESRDAATGHNVLVSVTIPNSHYRQLAAARDLLPAATHDEASRLLAAIEQEVITDVRTRFARLSGTIDPSGVRETLSVETIAAAAADDLLVAAAESSTTAAFLSRSRTALVCVTVLMTCWLLWTIIRTIASRAERRTAAADAETTQPPAGRREPGSRAAAAEGFVEGAAAFASEIPAERLAEVLKTDRDGVVLEDVVPHSPRPAQQSAGDQGAAGPVNRLRTADTGSWDIDELSSLPDAQLRRLVRSVAVDTWPAALSAAAPTTRRRLLSALPDGEAEQLREVLRHVRPIRLDDIDVAQREVQSALAAC